MTGLWLYGIGDRDLFLRWGFCSIYKDNLKFNSESRILASISVDVERLEICLEKFEVWPKAEAVQKSQGITQPCKLIR